MKAFQDIISSIDTSKSNINPTEIYNEGWMTRLLVYYSIKEGIQLKGIDFAKINNWTSEALIGSPFINAPEHREGYTHADMALGDFKVDFETRGEIVVDPEAKVFGIIEAKMGSNLSQRTTHAEHYNQGSRNLACIANQTYKLNCNIFFAVVAPKIKIEDHRIRDQIIPDFIIAQIRSRFNAYPNSFKVKQQMDLLIAKAQQCKIWSISYEEWLQELNQCSQINYLSEFYDKSLKWNRI